MLFVDTTLFRGTVFLVIFSHFPSLFFKERNMQVTVIEKLHIVEKNLFSKEKSWMMDNSFIFDQTKLYWVPLVIGHANLKMEVHLKI